MSGLVVLTDIDAEGRADALPLKLGHFDGQRVAALPLMALSHGLTGATPLALTAASSMKLA